MPGAVQNAVPSTVMPWSLARSFVHDRNFPVEENQYQNGESQRDKQADTSRKRWRLAHRLAPTDLAALLAFYDARNGPHEPFYFYDVHDTSPKFAYDETGVETTGRFTVRFDCAWRQTVGIARADVEIAITEIT